MLSALKVKNLRCFADSGRLEFGKLNILIGPNNAGKSALLSAVELLLQNSLAVHGGAPLSFAGQPQFSAFSSTLRRQWGPHEQRPSQIVLDAEWGSVDDAEEALRWWTTFRLSGSESDDETFVSEADYGLLDGSKRRSNPEVSVSRRTIGRGMSYGFDQLPVGVPRARKGSEGEVEPSFSGVFFPDWWVSYGGPRGLGVEAGHTGRPGRGQGLRPRRKRLVVIRPYRLMPRPFYVLDDPSLSDEDRGLISDLRELWARNGEDAAAQRARAAIVGGLRTLELARHIEVTSPMSRARSVVQVRVSTASRRQGGTLADVGFGLSQVLPLVAREASLDSGYLVSYQPEVHLHPFAQSRLADLFVRSVERGNLVFVETHSEYLVLRVQYLVAEGKIPANAVRVFCVEPKRDRSAVRPMAFDECGRPLTRWPDGFLDTALKLAKEIVEKRVASSVSRVSPVA